MSNFSLTRVVLISYKEQKQAGKTSVSVGKKRNDGDLTMPSRPILYLSVADQKLLFNLSTESFYNLIGHVEHQAATFSALIDSTQHRISK